MSLMKRLFVRRAFVEGQWLENVDLEINDRGYWASVQSGHPVPPRESDVTLMPGVMLPGFVNSHSHAFQRAIAGLTEYRQEARNGKTSDSFWTWRERMYQAANRISPQDYEVIARLLYSELLSNGYTQICEFHYLHHQPDGQHYPAGLDMLNALLNAAQTVGIGLTYLPTLYERGGFDDRPLSALQQRFATNPDWVLEQANQVNRQRYPLVNAGVAIHSLRAARPDSVLRLIRDIESQTHSTPFPIHIHIAEQLQEVKDSIQALGTTPVQWLLDHCFLDESWNLVHATHASMKELEQLAPTNASVAICPSTEANLGDGFFPVPEWLELNGRWTIGSDSHVTRSPTHELQLLEYGQRLQRQSRNLLSGEKSSVADKLLSDWHRSAQHAAGIELGNIRVGQRADFLIIEPEKHENLIGIPSAQILDAWVFSQPSRKPDAVFVSGKRVEHDPALRQRWRDEFCEAMQRLWG